MLDVYYVFVQKTLFDIFFKFSQRRLLIKTFNKLLYPRTDTPLIEILETTFFIYNFIHHK